MWFSNRSDTNRAVQTQKMARGWRVSIKVEGLYHRCSKNNGADQLCSYCAFVFADADSWFSRATAQITFLSAGCNLQECGPKQYCYQAIGGTAECRCTTNYVWDATQEKCVYSPGKI